MFIPPALCDQLECVEDCDWIIYFFVILFAVYCFFFILYVAAYMANKVVYIPACDVQRAKAYIAVGQRRAVKAAYAIRI